MVDWKVIIEAVGLAITICGCVGAFLRWFVMRIDSVGSRLSKSLDALRDEVAGLSRAVSVGEERDRSAKEASQGIEDRVMRLENLQFDRGTKPATSQQVAR